MSAADDYFRTLVEFGDFAAKGWDTILHQGKFKNVEFHFVSVRDEHAREVDKRRYPGRDGADLQDRGSNELTITVRAVFFDNSYPEQMNELLRRIDEGGVGELQHPVFGHIQALCERAVVQHDAEDGVDFATVELTFIEHTESAIGPFEGTSLASGASVVRAAQADLDLAIAQLLDPDALLALPDRDDGLLACSFAAAANVAAGAAATTIETSASDLSTSEITTIMNTVLIQVDHALGAIEDYTTPEGYALGRALISLAAASRELATRALEALPPLIQVTVTDSVPLLVWVFRRYGTTLRAEEVLRLNSIKNPLMLPRNLKLWCYAV